MWDVYKCFYVRTWREDVRNYQNTFVQVPSSNTVPSTTMDGTVLVDSFEDEDNRGITEQHKDTA